MLETIKKAIKNLIQWKHDGLYNSCDVAPSLPEPQTDSPVAAEPDKAAPPPTELKPEDIRASWRPNRIYESEAARKRAWRERQKQQPAATNDSPIVATPVVEPATETGPEPRIPWDALSSLIAPGPNAMLMPVQTIGEPIFEAEPVPVVPEPIPATEINWADEARIDLPVRTPEQVARLLKFETEQQTQERIENDQIRYANQRAGRSTPNQQSAITKSGQDASRVATWVKR